MTVSTIEKRQDCLPWEIPNEGKWCSVMGHILFLGTAHTGQESRVMHRTAPNQEHWGKTPERQGAGRTSTAWAPSVMTTSWALVLGIPTSWGNK